MSSRPQSQIEIVQREPLEKAQRSVPSASSSVINSERQTQSPVSQHVLSQPNLSSQQLVTSHPVSNLNTDMLSITKDMHRLSVDSASLEQARALKQFSSQSSTSSGISSAGSGITKSGSASSLQGTSSNKSMNSGSQHTGETVYESAGSLGSTQGYQPGYQQTDVLSGNYNVVQEGIILRT